MASVEKMRDTIVTNLIKLRFVLSDTVRYICHQRPSPSSIANGIRTKSHIQIGKTMAKIRAKSTMSSFDSMSVARYHSLSDIAKAQIYPSHRKKCPAKRPPHPACRLPQASSRNRPLHTRPPCESPETTSTQDAPQIPSTSAPSRWPPSRCHLETLPRRPGQGPPPSSL